MSFFPDSTVAVAERGRPRFWLLYAAAWTPLAAIYALLIAQPGMGILDAIVGSLSSVVPAALLGVVIVGLTERIADAKPSRGRFLLVHTLLAIIYGAAWCGAIIASIYWGAPRDVLAAFMKDAAGWQFVSGLMLYAVIAGIAAAIRSSRRLREQEAAAVRSEALRVRAELQALRAQLNPHFLFNTLHSLIALVRRDPPKAEAALERFGDLLRYVLDVNRDLLDEVAVADELNFVRSYLSLEQLRLGDRLRIEEQIDADALDCLIPSFTLQPLVENAIRHGIAPQARGGTLRIAARLEGDRLVMEVSDDGGGASAESVGSAEGLGLRAVRQRIEARYGTTSSFAVTTAPDRGFTVRLAIPATASRRMTPRMTNRVDHPAAVT
jgi:sensor histidine kinase YesM